MSTLTQDQFREADLTPGEINRIARWENMDFIKERLRRLDAGEYLTIARIAREGNPDKYVGRLRDRGIDIGVDGHEYGVWVASKSDETKEVRVFKRWR